VCESSSSKQIPHKRDRHATHRQKSTGILSILDDESVFPNATDATFLEKLHGKHTHNPKYEKPRFDKTTFGIQHYAGQVIYQTEGWLDKNKDPLANDLMLSMQASDDHFVSGLFSDELNPVQSIAAASQRKKAAAFNTVGFQYKVGYMCTRWLGVCGDTHPIICRERGVITGWAYRTNLCV